MSGKKPWDKQSMHAYDDIIGMQHPISKTHPRMSRHDRAAQFSPFAALTGYGNAIAETERLTEARIELDENEKEILDGKLRKLQADIRQHPEISVTYFLPDRYKEGGAYVTVDGKVQEIDQYERVLVMQDGSNIPVREIVAISIPACDKVYQDP